jgi:hypothetical protein
MSIRIWIDDERKPLPGYTVWFRNDFDKFQDYIKSNVNEIIDMSFDHDLGHSLNGLQLITMVEEMVFNGIKFPKLESIYIHTANGAAKKPMLYAAHKIHDGESIIRNYEWAIDSLFDTWSDNNTYDEVATINKRFAFRNTEFDGTIF